MAFEGRIYTGNGEDPYYKGGDGMNWADYLIIALLVLGFYNGYKRGLFGSLLGLAANLAGIAAAYHYYPHLARWADSRWDLTAELSRYLYDHLGLSKVSFFQFKLEELPLASIGAYIDQANIPPILKTNLLEYWQSINSRIIIPWQQQAGSFLPQYLATFILNLLAFLLIWIVVAKLISLLGRLFTMALESTALGRLDRLAGGTVGLALTGLLVTVLIGLVNPLLGFAGVLRLPFLGTLGNALGTARMYPFFINLFSSFSGYLEKFLLY